MYSRPLLELVFDAATDPFEEFFASEEQAGGLSEVNAAIAQMDSMTQQNAALVEQTTAAVQALGGQASELGSLMGFFRVSTATQLTGRPAPKALPDHR